MFQIIKKTVPVEKKNIDSIHVVHVPDSQSVGGQQATLTKSLEQGIHAELVRNKVVYVNYRYIIQSTLLKPMTLLESIYSAFTPLSRFQMSRVFFNHGLMASFMSILLV